MNEKLDLVESLITQRDMYVGIIHYYKIISDLPNCLSKLISVPLPNG